MVKDAVAILSVIYVPLMYGLAGALLLLGILGLLAPWSLRRIMNIFTRNGPVRLLGILLIIVGAEMFIQARHTALPPLVKVLGAVLFIDGGVRLFVPTLAVIIMERVRMMKPAWLRLVGLLGLGVAWLFYLAAKLPPPPVA